MRHHYAEPKHAALLGTVLGGSVLATYQIVYLAITRQLVQAHGGSIDFSERHGRGTRVATLSNRISTRHARSCTSTSFAELSPLGR